MSKDNYVPRYYLKNGREIGINPHKGKQPHIWEPIPDELICTESVRGTCCGKGAIEICVPCGFGRCEEHVERALT